MKTIEELLNELPIDMMLGRTYFPFSECKWVVASYDMSKYESGYYKQEGIDPLEDMSTTEVFYGETSEDALKEAIKYFKTLDK